MIVSWMTTNKCNLKCALLSGMPKRLPTGELNTEEAMKMIDEIARAPVSKS